MNKPAKTVKLDDKVQKSLWLTQRTRNKYDRLARKRRTTPGELMRLALIEWVEANK